MSVRLALALVVLTACDGKKAATPPGSGSPGAPAGAAAPAPAAAASPAPASPKLVAAPAPASPKPVAAPAPAPKKLVEARAMTPEDLWAIEAELGKQLETTVRVFEPFADERKEERHTFVIYEHAATADCDDCPTEAELTLNPGCSAYGVAYATFSRSAPTVTARPLNGGGCTLELVGWEVLERWVTLEVVSSKVQKWDRKRKEPVLTSRRQHIAVWSFGDESEDSSRAPSLEPSLALELAQWPSRRGTPEPPVRPSAFLHEVNGGLVLVELLPCSDPWSDEACDAYVRKRKVHEVQ